MSSANNDLIQIIIQNNKKILTKLSFNKKDFFILRFLKKNIKPKITKEKSATNLLKTNPNGIKHTRYN
tara:strand:- start:274 stop:477 length:204 start_codon:yes stop_codon:yes gene_type:complete